MAKRKETLDKELDYLINPTYTNIYYFRHINLIGGVETFFYQLGKKYNKYDLTVVYTSGDPAQIQRLQKYIRCVKYTGQHIKCKKAFFNYNMEIIDNIEAEEYVAVIHGDYKNLIETGKFGDYPHHPKITKYIGVSQLACESISQLTGESCELCYNPYIKEKSKPVLKLISATRLTSEKGYDRMVRLMDELDKKGVEYLWLIFTDDKRTIKNEHVIFMKPTLNIAQYTQGADFIVQLSDSEGYCYSVVEAWSYGVPAIITDLPVLKEIGASDKNSIILDLDMGNVDEAINRMINDNFNFTYKIKEDNWENLLGPEKSTYIEELKYIYKVEATNLFKEYKITDKERECIPEPGEEWEVERNRLIELLEEDGRGAFVIYKGKRLKKEEELKCQKIYK